jgi:LysM repeat protein
VRSWEVVPFRLMRRIAALFAFTGLLVFCTSGVLAQEPASPSSEKADLHALRQMVEQQGKQIDALAREIAQLSEQIADLHKPSGVAGVAPAPAARAEGAAPAAAGPTEGASEPAPAAPGAGPADAPKAEAVTSPGGSLKHTVAKGETLTSIAKQYNIPVVELQKANKIHDERKLQIGQILNIPSEKTPPPSNKKETP